MYFYANFAINLSDESPTSSGLAVGNSCAQRPEKRNSEIKRNANARLNITIRLIFPDIKNDSVSFKILRASKKVQAASHKLQVV